MTSRERSTKILCSHQNKVKNTFLHVYAQRYSLEELFRELGQTDNLQENLSETLHKQNYNGETFLSIAIDKVTIEGTEQIIKAMEMIAGIFGEDAVSKLCQMTDTKKNNLLHLAGQRSLKDLVSYLLPRTIVDVKKLNSDGLNPLHVAVYKNDCELIQSILNTEVDVDSKTLSQETSLHIAAKQGHLEALEELIRHGGDLSAQDTDKHTPLHDCLQQVYFEVGYEEETKCEKFIKVWNKVVEQAVTWWCMRQKHINPITEENEYMGCQIKAVYYLRSCIKNKDGLSVLQYAADRGLVKCVQVMLATKGVFAIQEEINPPTKNDKDKPEENHFKFKIDITNLTPKYCVSLKELYQKEELENLGLKIAPDMQKKGLKSCFRSSSNIGTDEERQILQENPEVNSKPSIRRKVPRYNTFLDALAKIEPSNKAGEILELIPLITLTKLQWRRFQWFSISWLIIHIILMIFLTHQSKREVTTGNKNFFGAPLIPMYASLIFFTNFSMKIQLLMERIQRDRAPQHEVKKDDKGVLSFFTKMVEVILDQMDLIAEGSFAGFTWAAFAATVTNMDNDIYAWIKGYALLSGWLVLLIPLRSYSPVYKLLSALKDITITDMFPWILLYITISSGFASAIQLQFQLLPGNSTCLEKEHDLKGVLHQTGDALFELVIMTTGLDTDLKHVRNLACLFEYNKKSIHNILFLVTIYAVVSAIVLLNMLIAIMSNTVTEAQQSKGWRQYQVNTILFINFRCKLDILRDVHDIFVSSDCKG